MNEPPLPQTRYEPSYTQTPYNPYLAPQAAPFPATNAYATHRTAEGGWVKWLYLLLTLGVPLAGLLSAFAILVMNVDVDLATQLEGATYGLVSLGHTVFALLWIYIVWSALPVDVREDTSPGGAVGALFIPFYNLVWAFQLNATLCRGIDRQLVERGQTAQAPRTLAVLAPTLHIITRVAGGIAGVCKAPIVAAYVPWISCIVWTVYMFRVDRARSLVAATTGQVTP